MFSMASTPIAASIVSAGIRSFLIRRPSATCAGLRASNSFRILFTLVLSAAESTRLDIVAACVARCASASFAFSYSSFALLALRTCNAPTGRLIRPPVAADARPAVIMRSPVNSSCRSVSTRTPSCTRPCPIPMAPSTAAALAAPLRILRIPNRAACVPATAAALPVPPVATPM